MCSAQPHRTEGSSAPATHAREPAGPGLRVAVVGMGRWGSKLAASLGQIPSVQLCAVVDPDAQARARAQSLAPQARLCATLEQLLALAPNAVVVASPSEQHSAQALALLEAGIDVLVEKPMATSAEDARAMCATARRSGRVAMVGHLLRYHPAVTRMIALVRDGFVGPLRRVVGRRLTQSGSPSALWTLGPHDLSTLHALDPSPVASLRVRPWGHGRAGSAAGVELELCLDSGVSARFELSTCAPEPARRLHAYGRSRVIGVDELDPRGGVAFATAAATAAGSAAGPTSGAATMLRDLEGCQQQPLQAELEHFVDCVLRRLAPLTSFDEGLWVVDTLARAQQSAASCLSSDALRRSVG